ncbi:GGDEF domain-containing protein [Sporomusa sp. KB1]|uniref:GGDEF domain-containing protein n=1 Tax=Sporomusa sp. KB1 TaxID=943346 RepID=UPI0011A18B06|nr:GGDEF domain-containing protein [Sporomusa sp. KB1]TWH45874.1 diguanylate cyclase (GGDEF)-like protein [Sporomusa sp. KB1]
MFYNYAPIILAVLGAIVGISGYYLITVYQIRYAWLYWMIISTILMIVGLINGKLINKLNLSAHTDFLTGLWNRRYFYLQLTEAELKAAKRNSSLCIAMIDADNFKAVNDIYGHMIGDGLLIDLATILKKNTRSSDVVTRWGGDEFAIIFSETSLEDTTAIIERIRYKVEHRLQNPYGLTISAGIVSLEPEQDSKNLLIKADQALYMAKAHKNSVIILNEF